MSEAAPLAGKRILIVEDEYLVASELAETVKRLGAEIVAMTGALEDAMQVNPTAIDGALVDIQLGADKSYPLIEKLQSEGVPVILTTGFTDSILPQHISVCPRIPKPFSPAQVKRSVLGLFKAS